MDKPSDHRPVWPWAVAAVVIAWLGWTTVLSVRAMNRHGDQFKQLLEAGTAPGDRWLADFRRDPAAAHAAASAAFRQRVPADRLAALKLPDPATPLRFQSAGSGSVTSGLLTPPVSVPPRLVLTGPGGLTLEFVPDGEDIRLDAIQINGIDPFADLSRPPG